MKFRFIAMAVATSFLVSACGPSAEDKAKAAANDAATIAQSAEAGDAVWLEARSLALAAYKADIRKTEMAGIIGRSMLLAPDSDDVSNESESFLLEGLPQDASLHWFLAKGYENGWYGEVDKEKGCEQYIAAANAKLNGAYWPTAVCYLEGTGVEKDEAAAFEWMSKSANAGDQNGMVSLAVLYATGQGTDKDTKSAATWYETALRTAGPNRAQALRGIGALHLFEDMDGAIPQRGYAFLELATEAGDTVAPRLLTRVGNLDETQRTAVDVQKEFLTNFYQLSEAGLPEAAPEETPALQ